MAYLLFHPQSVVNVNDINRFALSDTVKNGSLKYVAVVVAVIFSIFMQKVFQDKWMMQLYMWGVSRWSTTASAVSAVTSGKHFSSNKRVVPIDAAAAVVVERQSVVSQSQQRDSQLRRSSNLLTMGDDI